MSLSSDSDDITEGNGHPSPTHTSRGIGCSALWCGRRVGDKEVVTLRKLLCTTRVAMGTANGKKKAQKAKKERDEQLSRIGRGDLVEAEKALMFGTPVNDRDRSKSPHVRVRVCSVHPDPRAKWPNGYLLDTDPVISGQMPGYDAEKVVAGSAIARARTRAVQVSSPDAAGRTARGQQRRRGDEVAALKLKVRRLEERVKKLEASTVPRISWANIEQGLLPDRPLFTIPRRKMRTWLDIMHANNLQKCWLEHVKANERKNSAAILAVGFEDACILVAMVCSTGCSQAHASWASGLTQTHGKANGQIIQGCVFRATIVVINYHYSRTVAQPPHLAQLDRDALPAFEGALDPGMENNLLTMDASNTGIHGKPQNPVGDAKSFSAYYGANCGKFEVVSDKAGNPAWVSYVYGGAASEKNIVLADNFKEWFGRFNTAMVGQAGQEFTVGMLADKGAWWAHVDRTTHLPPPWLCGVHARI